MYVSHQKIQIFIQIPVQIIHCSAAGVIIIENSSLNDQLLVHRKWINIHNISIAVNLYLIGITKAQFLSNNFSCEILLGNIKSEKKAVTNKFDLCKKRGINNDVVPGVLGTAPIPGILTNIEEFEDKIIVYWSLPHGICFSKNEEDINEITLCLRN